MNEVNKGKLIHQLAEDAVNTGLSVLKITEAGLERVPPEDILGMPQQAPAPNIVHAGMVMIPRHMLDAAVDAFNQIPNTELGRDDYPTTYNLVVDLDKLRR